MLGYPGVNPSWVGTQGVITLVLDIELGTT